MITDIARQPGLIASTLAASGGPGPTPGALRIGPLEIWPPLTLAPMAGETGSPLRQICRRLGAGMVCTELTSSHGLYYGNIRSLEFLQWTASERPVSAQIFGGDPDVMAVAAEMCCGAGCDLIDINMGCWVPKVARTGAGASLLKDMRRAEAVMRAVVNASSVPVTIKTRVGWDGCTGSAIEMARAAEQCGVAAVAIHGRTAVQGFTGHADWAPIAAAKAAVGIPIIGNGDVRDADDARRMFTETGCDGVMIGRAALGNPWIFREISGVLFDGAIPEPPSDEERLETCREHAFLMAGLRSTAPVDGATPIPAAARGQLAHYLHTLPNAAAARRRMTQVNTYGDVCRVIDDVLEDLLAATAAGERTHP